MTMLLISMMTARGCGRQRRATEVLRVLVAEVGRVLHGRVGSGWRGAVAAATGAVVGVGQGRLSAARRWMVRSKGRE